MRPHISTAEKFIIGTRQIAAPLQAPANDRYTEVMIGGLKTACVSRRQLADLMVQDCFANRVAAVRRPKLVFASNGHGIAFAGLYAKYKAYFNEADIIHADGQAVVFASKLLTSTAIPERSVTTDFIHDAMKAGAEYGLRFYLFGATEEVNAKCAEILTATYPDAQIVGRRHGYFSIDEEDDVVDDINLTCPDVVFVGLGLETEYAFSVRNRDRLNAGWVITCGGCFNYVTGHYERAPAWMQQAGLEWLYRLYREPRRLFWRYAITNPAALLLILTRSHTLDAGREKKTGSKRLGIGRLSHKRP
jgi:exopolysaccharide biosynthesis WecB/TagA/CpsF family protein